MSDNNAAIDARALREVTGGDRRLERNLFAQFRKVSEEDMASLRLAIARRDFVLAARATHRLKGASATIGATRFAAMCHRCERSARNGHIGALADGLGELEAQLRRVIAFLETMNADR